MNKGIVCNTEDGKILVRIAKEFYKREAVFAAAHKLTEKFAVMIKPLDEYTVGVYLEPKPAAKLDKRHIDEAIHDFLNNLLDEQVRLDLEKDYGILRELIVKQAFAPISSAELSVQIDATRK